jgi:hypothetical protein
VSVQPSLFPDVARTEHVWKRQRQTAREVYRQRRVDDRARQAAGVETREGQVLRLLAAHWNATQQSPTALELLAWARARGERLFDCNSVRPRIFALVEHGLVDKGAKRKCACSGKVAWTWVVREQGSVKR